MQMNEELQMWRKHYIIQKLVMQIETFEMKQWIQVHLKMKINKMKMQINAT